MNRTKCALASPVHLNPLHILMFLSSQNGALSN